MDNKAIKLLVVDDEPDIRRGLGEYLELEGFSVDTVPGATEAIASGVSGYDLILLDVMMDGIDGFEFARQLKADPQTAHIPVIFLTAKSSDDDMVAGLGLGADDYISKPFSMKNLIARVHTVLRRTRRVAGHPVPQPSGVVCDRLSLTCRVDGREVQLPRKEFEILALLLKNPGRIFTREELMRRVWPENVIVTERSIDVHITRIRSKIAPYGKHVVSRSGYGYGWAD